MTAWLVWWLIYIVGIFVVLGLSYQAFRDKSFDSLYTIMVIVFVLYAMWPLLWATEEATSSGGVKVVPPDIAKYLATKEELDAEGVGATDSSIPIQEEFKSLPRSLDL